jgi:hypothetical protein
VFKVTLNDVYPPDTSGGTELIRRLFAFAEAHPEIVDWDQIGGSTGGFRVKYYGSPVRTPLQRPSDAWIRMKLANEIVERLEVPTPGDWSFMNDHLEHWVPFGAVSGQKLWRQLIEAGFPKAPQNEGGELEYGRDITALFVDREKRWAFQLVKEKPYQLYWAGVGEGQSALYLKSVKTMAEVLMEVAARAAEIPDDPESVYEALKTQRPG